ncbi:hypothetical protein P3T23_007197 [Paraburkholderia sp. GAS448]|jgi:hypothetical protein
MLGKALASCIKWFAIVLLARGDETMRRLFNIAVFALLAYLIADRAMVHAQAGESGSITCQKGAELVKLDALGKGFGETASSVQGENFLSSCLVTGQGRVGNLIARD